MKPPVVFLVDDDAAVRKAVSLLLKSSGLECLTFASGEEFLSAYDPDQPGCLITDMRMPGLSGLDLQNRLKTFSQQPPVILITGHGDVPAAVRALKQGALDFIEKPFNEQVLLDAVNNAIGQDRDRREKYALINQWQTLVDSLSDREEAVMALVAKGCPNKIIAADLSLSIKTVEYHRGNLMGKLGVESVADLVRIYLAIGKDTALDD
ncbi:MAG: response regulator [Gemmatimonadales bacterium]|nr:response regulator [Gemmatimonadales bacterium]